MGVLTMIKRRALQFLMAALGIILMARFAAPGIIDGATPYAVNDLVDVLLDSEFRFLSTLAGANGLAFFWMIPQIEKQAALFTILAAGSLVGGLARLLSMAQHGLPANKAVIATGVELIVPLLALLLLWSITHDKSQHAAADE